MSDWSSLYGDLLCDIAAPPAAAATADTAAATAADLAGIAELETLLGAASARIAGAAAVAVTDGDGTCCSQPMLPCLDHQGWLQCGLCGRLMEGTLETERAPVEKTLRVRGAGSSDLQRDLWRSSSGQVTHEQRAAEVLKLYLRLRDDYVKAGGRAYPQDALNLAAEYYAVVAGLNTKRPQSKKVSMAFILMRACHEIGFAPKRGEVAAFMQLPSRGISEGASTIRELVLAGQLPESFMDEAPSVISAEIRTCLRALDPDLAAAATMPPAALAVEAAATELVALAASLGVGTNSVVKTRVLGAIYVVVTRSPAEKLPLAFRVKLPAFCHRADIRESTAQGYLREISDYHSHFVDLYQRHGLDPGEGLVAVGGRARRR